MIKTQGQQKSNLLDSELLNFMATRGKASDSNYVGKYHHLKVDWQSSFSDREDMTALISDALDIVSIDERREFFAQMVWRILDGGDALEQLLSAAFGQRDNAKCL